MTSDPSPLPDQWFQRDLVVLRDLVEHFESGGDIIRASEVAARVDLDEAAVRRSIKRLTDEGCLRIPGNMPRTGDLAGEIVIDITPQALRLTGVWPTPESALDRMITTLEEIAANTDDEDTRTRAQKVLAGLTGAGKSIGVAVATAVVTGHVPGAH